MSLSFNVVVFKYIKYLSIFFYIKIPIFGIYVFNYFIFLFLKKKTRSLIFVVKPNIEYKLLLLFFKWEHIPSTIILENEKKI